eukprot:1280263-Amphidinium_carterae.2
MRQSSGFEAWQQLTLHYAGGHRAQQFSLLRTIMQPSWDSTTKQFTKQYYKSLEGIRKYESENGQGSITDQVKIAAIINHLKGPIAQHLMLRVNNTTTFTEVHQWISNFSNSTYRVTEEENGTIGGVTDETEKYNEQAMIAFNKWYKGKGRGQWNKSKETGKGKEGKKGDNFYNAKGAGKNIEQQPVICYACGRPGHTKPQCYQNTKGKGNKGQSGRNHTNTTVKDNKSTSTSNHLNSQLTNARELENLGTTTSTTTPREQARKEDKSTISTSPPITTTTARAGIHLTTHNQRLMNNSRNHHRYLAHLHSLNIRKWECSTTLVQS